MVRAILNAALVKDHPLAESCVIEKSLRPTDESKSELCYQEMGNVNWRNEQKEDPFVNRVRYRGIRDSTDSNPLLLFCDMCGGESGEPT